MNVQSPRNAMASALLVRRLVAHLSRLGTDVYAVAPSLGLGAHHLSDRHALVPLRAAMRLYDYAAKALDDPLIGLTVAHGCGPQDYGLAGYVLTNHAHVGQGYRDVGGVLEALLPVLRIRIYEQGPNTVLQLGTASEIPGLDLFVQDVLTSLFMVGQQITVHPLDAVSVSVRATPRDSAQAAWARACFRGPVSFGASVHTLTLRSSDLDVVNPSANATLLAHLHEAVETQVARRRVAGGRTEDVVRLKGCFVDLGRGEVVRGETRESLTGRERALLAYLSRRPNEVVSREELEREVWNIGREVVTHAHAVAVRRLRQKIEPDPRHPVNLVTVFGEGWRLDVRPEDPDAHMT